MTCQDLTPYWHFVEAAMVALEAKQWHLEATKLGKLCSGPCAARCELLSFRVEVLSIWPRMSFFVDDGVYLNRRFLVAQRRSGRHGSSVGPVMHHGIKDL